MAFPADIQVSNTFLLDQLIAGLAYPWQDWTPTWQAQAGTYTVTTLHYARYRVIGNGFEFMMRASGTTSSTPTWIGFSLPLTPASGIDNGNAATANIYDGGEKSSTAYYATSVSKVLVYKYDAATFPATTGIQIRCNGFYETA